MKVWVVIPAYNNVRTIGRIVADCRSRGFPVLTVDDGSTDGSDGAARRAGADVVRLSENRGKGAALDRGWAHIAAEFLETDYVVTLDGDGEHDPSDIPKLLEAAAPEPALVIGRRDFARMPFMRRLANRLVSALISRMIGIRVADTQSGFRVIPVRLMKDGRFSAARYGIETEMLIEAARRGIPIREVPIRTAAASKAPFLRKDLANLFDIIAALVRP